MWANGVSKREGGTRAWEMGRRALGQREGNGQAGPSGGRGAGFRDWNGRERVPAWALAGHAVRQSGFGYSPAELSGERKEKMAAGLKERDGERSKETLFPIFFFFNPNANMILHQIQIEF